MLVLLCLAGLEWILPFYTTSFPLLLQALNQMPVWSGIPSKHSCLQREVTWKVNKMIVLGLGCPLWLSASSNSWNQDFIGFGCGLGLGMFKSPPISVSQKNMRKSPKKTSIFSSAKVNDYLFLSPFYFPSFSIESKKAYTFYHFCRHAEQIYKG